MIHVSCGSFHSTSLEIFLNFFQCLSKDRQKEYILHCNKNLVERYAVLAGCSISNLNFNFLENSTEENLCLNSLMSALKDLKNGDVLLTLPANKKDLIQEGKEFLGHTEFLRNYWKIPNLPMTFISPYFALLLLTDHIPLNQVSTSINPIGIFEKISLFLDSYKYAKQIKRIIFWGINPHAGENGLLGIEEAQIVKARDLIASKYPNLDIVGPISSDGNFQLNFNKSSRYPRDLIVSPYHDQGLVFLKSSVGFLAANCTFGGPYCRLSPDHGTAVELIYKRQAIYNSLFWCDELVHSWQNNE